MTTGSQAGARPKGWRELFAGRNAVYAIILGVHRKADPERGGAKQGG
jgi:hypothetical protein